MNFKKIISPVLLSLLVASPLVGTIHANAAITQVDGTGSISKLVATIYGDSTTMRGFTWYTSNASTNTSIQVVEKKGSTPDFTSSMEFGGTAYPSFNSPNEMVHKGEAVGLKPNATYFYRVGDSSIDLWSTSGEFKTAPKSGAFTFINMADTQAKTLDEAELSAETIQKSFQAVPNAEFFSINGDIVDSGKNETQWNWLLGNAQNSLLHTTLVPVAGNHDADPRSFMDHFDVKTPEGANTTSGAYYSYDYSSTHFVVINNNENSGDYSNFSAEQEAWLKQDVTEAKANGAKWVILKMHKGPYTTSNHATDKDIIAFRQKIAPLMENLGIDLVLQGHDHIYARSKPIKNGVPQTASTVTEVVNGKKTDYYVKPQGTIYVIPATAGAKTYYRNKNVTPAYLNNFVVANEHSAAVYGPDPKDPTRPARGNVQNFLGVTVEDNKLTVVTYEIDQHKNNAQPYIIDQFGIEK